MQVGQCIAVVDFLRQQSKLHRLTAQPGDLQFHVAQYGAGIFGQTLEQRGFGVEVRMLCHPQVRDTRLAAVKVLD